MAQYENKNWKCKTTGDIYQESLRQKVAYGSHEVVILKPMASGEEVQCTSFNIHEKFTPSNPEKENEDQF